MPSNTGKIDAASISETFPRVKSNIIRSLQFKPLDPEEGISYYQVLLLFIIISFSTYVSFLLSGILRLKFFKVIFAIIFPVVPLLGCLFIGVYAYISGCVYAEMLSATNRGSARFMYTSLLGGVFLPIVVFITNALNSFHYILFICLGIYSEYFCRRSLTRNRHFENKNQKINFIGISLLTNLGFYVIIMPLFFSH